jgi:hypothetical protein
VVVQPSHAEGRWVPPGQPVTIGAHVIRGGLIYAGRNLRAPTGGIEPALVNPELPVAPVSGPVSGPAPAYHLLSPSMRTRYLAWLAGGRLDEAPSSLVLLFCFGLERRVLVDEDPGVRRELPAITAEVRRLRARCGPLPALDRLLDLLELVGAPRASAGPAVPDAPRSPSRMTVRLALARCAATAAPVPAGWAHAWAEHHPALARRSAQTRCPEEFGRLFAVRYRDRHGTGLVPPEDVAGIRLSYQPASPGLATALVCREDLPDVFSEPRCVRALGTLVDGVATALDPYSRWLARFPQGRGTLTATTMLPAELVDPRSGQLGALRVWAESRLSGRPRAVVEVAELGRYWRMATPDRMARDETIALLTVLSLLGFGIEPDARFGAPTLAPGPAVLFRLRRPAADRPGARFPAAAAAVRCAAAVASAAGPVDPAGPVGAAVLAAAADLAAVLRLEPGEDLRITARLAWLLATGVDVDRLGRQTAPLTAADREVAGRYLVTVAAAADPAVGPATIAMLTRVYRILRLEPALVFGRLHEHSLGPPAALAPQPGPPWADEPVVVQAAGDAPHGYALPWAVPLDEKAIAHKLAESTAAAALLAEIFDEDEPPPPARSADCLPPAAGLDAVHSGLLRALAARRSWTREEFGSLAAAHGVLPDGALDRLNEAAIDTVGAPVVEDSDTLMVDHDVLQELLA